MGLITRAIMSDIRKGLERLGLRRSSGLRITPLEGMGKFDPKAAIQTTNLVLMSLDPERANKAAE